MYPCIEFTNYKQVDKTDELKFVAVPEKKIKRVQNHQLSKCHLAKRLWENYLISLGLSLLMCKMKTYY